MFEARFKPLGFLPEDSIGDGARLAETADVIELSDIDLPAACPPASVALWAWHPRVFLDVVNQDEAMCPYCGTRYRLRRDARFDDHECGKRCLHQHRHRYESRRGAKVRTAPAKAATGGGEAPNLAADSLGNTALELMTRWIRRRWN